MASDVELVLASTSPRRRELIGLLGIPFRVVASRYEEPPPPRRPVSLPELVMELAAQKALEVARRLEVGWVLGADTLVCVDEGVGIPLGKPTDAADARRMLKELSGRSHFVYTGIALIPPWQPGAGPAAVRAVGRTAIWFRDLTDAMIDDYVATGEPMDKAGAYGAQGYAAPLIERYEGDFFNVVGLPLCEVGRLLEKCGLDWHAMRRSALRAAAELPDNREQPG
jgi:septum formation protein